MKIEKGVRAKLDACSRIDLRSRDRKYNEIISSIHTLRWAENYIKKHGLCV